MELLWEGLTQAVALIVRADPELLRISALSLAVSLSATLLAAAGSLLAAALALLVVNGAAVRFTMGAFTLRVDSVALIVGCGTGLLLGVVGALPPAVRAMRLPVAEGLKAV